MLGTESFWLKNIILANNSRITFVRHDQDWNLGRGEISLHDNKLDDVGKSKYSLPDISWHNTRMTSDLMHRRPGRRHHSGSGCS